jgi:hypothetical protein
VLDQAPGAGDKKAKGALVAITVGRAGPATTQPPAGPSTTGGPPPTS